MSQGRCSENEGIAWLDSLLVISFCAWNIFIWK